MSVERSKAAATPELEVGALNGWFMLLVNLVLLIGAVVFFFASIGAGTTGEITEGQAGLRALLAVLVFIAGWIMLSGHFTLQPNEARVQILFGAYKGTVRRSGFYWANPFYTRNRGKVAVGIGKVTNSSGHKTDGIVYKSLKTKISLRAHNFNSEKLKVNDKRGNPVEIAAVVVWRVEDTAQAAFDVEDYESYVQVQSNQRSGASRASTHTITARTTRSRCAAAATRSLTSSRRSSRCGS